MPKLVKHLLIGSTEAHSGKSTASIAIGLRLQSLGFQIGWGKPLAAVDATGCPSDSLDTDLSFVPNILSLSPEYQAPTLFSLNSQTFMDRLGQNSPDALQSSLGHYQEKTKGEITLLEGPSSLEEGALLNLSLPEMTQALDAAVLLVMQFGTCRMVDQLLSAQKRLGNNLLGVLLNQVDEAENGSAVEKVISYLEKQGIPVLGALPNLPFLRGIRVSELVDHLNAEVLCCDDHLDLVVESLKIGAMNVNAALRFFGQGMHQAIVTGGDRRDLQIAALETSTHCLVLTGQIAPAKDVIALAKDKEVPILSVETDTLNTVERIDALLGRIPLQNPDKVPLIQDTLAQQIDVERLLSLIGLEIPAIAPQS